MENIKNEVENEVKAVEVEVAKVVSPVKVGIEEAYSDAKKVEGVVAADVSAAVKEVVGKIVKTEIAITTEERLVIRELETGFLRLQLDLQNIQRRIEDTTKKYDNTVAALAKKYECEATHIFDLASAMFKKVEKAV